MGTLLGAFVLSLTVVTVVAIGILVAFGAVILILQAFAPEDKAPREKPPVLAHTQARAAAASGD